MDKSPAAIFSIRCAEISKMDDVEDFFVGFLNQRMNQDRQTS